MGEIDLTSSDPNFVRELIQEIGEEGISACFMCRTCVASCPIAEVDQRFHPLRIIRMALYGLKNEVLRSDFVWLCSSCYACQERCPQGVRVTEVMTALKNIAVREGYAPQGIRIQMELIKGTGRIYPIDDFDNKKREKAGLPSLPVACEGVKKLFKDSGT